ncbi:MAG: GxxExxY protein [Phenylobacterium sp.]|nr:MAG: GxxExxY protein [Phenylobacterium sp.]
MSHEPDEPLLHAGEVFRIQGAVFEVNKVLGPGFLEAVYQECLGLEFAHRKIPFRAQPRLALTYKDILLEQTYSPDFICYEKVIVELKAGRDLAEVHRAQVLNYLRATGLRLGLLVHFGLSAKARVERLAL